MILPKRIAVIGAGGSGLTAAKSCLESDLEVICYEKSDDIGGLWVYRDQDKEGQASVMRSTIINTSKEMTAFSDFPPPDHFPNFMHNRYVSEYLALYAKHFQVVQHVRLRHEVLKVSPASDYEQTGRWKVLVNDIVRNQQVEEVFDGVMICAGHHVYPIIPDMPGLTEFRGKKQHSHSLKTADGFEGKNVLVVGNGNSGVDVAVEMSSVAKQVYLSTRRGFWLLGRTFMRSKPMDIVTTRRILYFLPIWITNFLSEMFLSMKIDYKAFKIQPDYPFFANHPTVNDLLPNKIMSGAVQIKGEVDHFTKHGVKFRHEDLEYPLDNIVLATGYSYRVPFLENDLVKVDDTSCDLFKLVFPPKLPKPTLAFIGIAQPFGAIFPISEIQARWFVQVMLGNCKLPTESAMMEEIRDRQAFLAKQFLDAVRHRTEVIWIDYMDCIACEIGAKPKFFRLLVSNPMTLLYVLFGPCLPYQYRLNGPHHWLGASQTIFQYSKRLFTPFDTRKCASKGMEMKKSQMWCYFVPVFILIMFIQFTI